MGYIHVEVFVNQCSKQTGDPCGDVVAFERRPEYATIIISDGIGSGLKANIAALICTNRLKGLLAAGFSLQRAFVSLVKTMERSKDPALQYAVFSVLRIFNDGEATFLDYEMPAPVFISARYVTVLEMQQVQIGDLFVKEGHIRLEPGDAVMLLSDGVTQAGIGHGFRNGWTSEGVAEYTNTCLREDGADLNVLPMLIQTQVREICHKESGDDTTVAIVSCRPGTTVNVLTGPAADPKRDRYIVQQFLAMEGTKVVCGGTTAKIVADYLGQQVVVDDESPVTVAPPHYLIPGIDLVTEGAVTLNQVCNILDEDPARYDELSGVTELCQLLRGADRVNFLVGDAVNPATAMIAFRQRGILTRDKIIPRIADKLRRQGKLVVVKKT